MTTFAAIPMRKPTFCACCIQPRRGLEPHVRPSSSGKLRVVFLCVDCAELAAFADLAQHEIGERSAGATIAPRDGNRQLGRTAR